MTVVHYLYTTPELEDVRRVLGLIENMRLLDDCESLEDVITELNAKHRQAPASNAEKEYVEDVLLVAHGEPWRWHTRLREQESGKEGEWTSYDDLREALGAKRLQLDRKAFEARPKDAAGHEAPLTFHLRSCTLGASRPWLAAFQQLIGDFVRVTAPKHLHFFTPIPGTPIGIEWMRYRFRVNSLEPLKRQDLRAAFRARYGEEKSTRRVGMRVPAERSEPGKTPDAHPPLPASVWQARGLVPRNVPSNGLKDGRRRHWNVDTQKILGTSHPIMLQRLRKHVGDRFSIPRRPKLQEVWFSAWREELFPVRERLWGDKLIDEAARLSALVQGTKASRILRKMSQPGSQTSAIADAIRGYEGLKDILRGILQHRLRREDWPTIYGQFGYQNLDEYLDGCEWRFEWNASNDNLTCYPARYVYQFEIPIVDRKTGELLFNAYFDPASKLAPLEPQLRVGDERFFATLEARQVPHFLPPRPTGLRGTHPPP